jgi:iron complex transport system permease protein
MGAGELFSDAVLGRPADGMDIDSPQTELLWFAVLNLGNRIAATASTDAALGRVHTRSPGDRRVYCKVDELSPGTIARAIRKGRTFATSGGPVFLFLDVEGHEPGDTLHPEKDGTYKAEVEVQSLHRLVSLHLYQNGRRIAEFDVAGKSGQILRMADIAVSAGVPGWLVARAEDENGDWAITSPVYFRPADSLYRPLGEAVLLSIVGAALGVAGAIFQNLTRNPMGSPDVIGLDAGAFTGALFAITVLSGTSVQLATGSVLGGLLVAAVVSLLSAGRRFSGLRLVVIGIGVNAMVTAVNAWIVLRAELEVAIAAIGWSAGSLNGVDWSDLWIPFSVIAVLLTLMAALAPAMHQTALGDAVAVTTGVGLGRLRLLMVLVGVGCTATVTAVAGPLAFIALAPPQIGRRLAGAAGVPLLPAALTGAVLLQGADLLAQVLLAPVALPVGVVSTAIGGCYLIWLLTKEVRRA